MAKISRSVSQFCKQASVSTVRARVISGEWTIFLESGLKIVIEDIERKRNLFLTLRKPRFVRFARGFSSDSRVKWHKCQLTFKLETARYSGSLVRELDGGGKLVGEVVSFVRAWIASDFQLLISYVWFLLGPAWKVVWKVWNVAISN